VSTVFKSGPVVDEEVQTRGEGPKSRLDPRRAQSQHDAAQPDYGVKSGDGQEGRNEAAERDPTQTQQQPVTVADEPGRNEKVTIRNNSTGETTEIKWKYAKKKIKQGWTLVS